MGYTHYWYRRRELEQPHFHRWVRDVAVLLGHLPRCTDTAGGHYRGHPLLVRGPLGTGDPVLSDMEVAFNGDEAAGLDHETFVVERVYQPYPQDTPDLSGRFFGFCKTARKPYDLAVTAALLLLQRHFGSAVRVCSDGTPQEWEPALELVTQVFGPDLAQSAWERVWSQKQN